MLLTGLKCPESALGRCNRNLCRFGDGYHPEPRATKVAGVDGVVAEDSEDDGSEDFEDSQDEDEEMEDEEMEDSSL